jgi:hypothetical protein
LSPFSKAIDRERGSEQEERHQMHGRAIRRVEDIHRSGEDPSTGDLSEQQQRTNGQAPHRAARTIS